MSGDYRIRTMTRAELDIAIEWAAGEGWNPGLHDAEAFHAADPDGFLVGLLDGEPVTSISVVAYDEGFAFLGFYLARPEVRGQGHGYRIWQAGMQRLGARNVGLDGVVAQQDNYRRSGFVYAYGNQRYQGQGGGGVPPGVVPLADVPFEQVLDYDRQCFPAARDGFLRHWLAQPGACCFALPGQGALHGYAMARPCREGFKIGPLFADSAEHAEALFQALAAEVGAGQPLYLDVPLPNAAAVEMAERHAMQPVFETARMYTGGAPDIALDRVFGVTSFELG